MDVNSIAKYVGKNHQEEVAQLMKADDKLASKVSLKNPVIACILSIFL